MNKHHRTVKLISLLFACVVSAGSIGAGLVASARPSNDNDNKNSNGRVARRPENSNNNTDETNGKPKPKSAGSGSSGSLHSGPKPPAQNCKGKGCDQKGGRG